MRLILSSLAAIMLAAPARAERYLVYYSTAPGTAPATLLVSDTAPTGLPAGAATFVWTIDPSDTYKVIDNYPLNASGQPAYVAPPSN